MFTAAIGLSFLSALCLYTASKKVEFEPNGILLLLKTNKTLAGAMAGSMFLGSTLLFIRQTELTVGVFTSLLCWMLMSSLLILFTPFGKVKGLHLALLLIVIAGIEISVRFL